MSPCKPAHILQVKRETDLAVHNPLGMAFVTFNSINDSKKVFSTSTGAFCHELLDTFKVTFPS